MEAASAAAAKSVILSPDLLTSSAFSGTNQTRRRNQLDQPTKTLLARTNFESEGSAVVRLDARRLGRTAAL